MKRCSQDQTSTYYQKIELHRICIILMSLCSIACSGSLGREVGQSLADSSLQEYVGDSFYPFSPNIIALLPIEANAMLGNSQALADRLNKRLSAFFDLETELEVMNNNSKYAERLNTALRELKNSGRGNQGRAAELGRRIKVNRIMFTEISAYERGDGSRLGAGNPARVDFTVKLLDLKLNTIVWSARFSRAEQSLSEDILRTKDAISKGFGFRTAPELMEMGFRQAAAALSVRLRDRGSNFTGGSKS